MEMNDFLLQIVLFAAGSAIGVGTALIQNNHKLLKALFIALAILMIVSSLLWAIYETNVATNTPTATALAESPPTNTISLTPTREPFAQTETLSTDTYFPHDSVLSDYDSFDNPKFEKTLAQSIWNSTATIDEITMLQEKGKLKFTAFGLANSGVVWIEPRLTMNTQLATYNSVQGEFSWEQATQGQIYFGITVSASNDLSIAYSCDFAINDVTSEFYCLNHNDHRSASIWLNPRETHTILIEFNRKDASFYAYLDGKLVDQYTPSNPQDWLTKNVAYDLHFACATNCQGITYLDNIRIGQPLP